MNDANESNARGTDETPGSPLTPDFWDKELREAAGRGDLARVLALLSSGRMGGADEWPIYNALCWASSAGRLAVMSALIDHGALLEHPDGEAWSPLTSALIRSGVRPDNLGLSVTEPDPRPLALLRAAGAQFRLRDAVVLGDLDLAGRLLDSGANPNTGAHGYYGSVLDTAARAGDLAMLDLLLARGASVDAIDDLNQTPLVSAVERGHVAVARRLLEQGANPRICSVYSQTLMTIAQNAANRRIIDLLHELPIDWEIHEIVSERYDSEAIVERRHLLDPGRLARLADELVTTRSPAHWSGQPPVDQVNFDSERLALHAARAGSVPALEILLDRGASHLSWDWDDRSLLAEAARHGHLAAIRLLIDRGADLHAVGRDGLTPLAWAMRENHPEAVDLLRRLGAVR